MHTQVFIMITNLHHAARINLSSVITERWSVRERHSHIYPHHAKIHTGTQTESVASMSPRKN